MTIEEKRKKLAQKYNGEDFKISKAVRSDNPNSIFLSIKGNKINYLTEEEKNILMDEDISLTTIYLDNNAINNLNIDNIKKYLEKAQSINISIDLDCLQNNISKINTINKINTNSIVVIKEDYKMKNRDYNLLNMVETKVSIPIKYAMWLDLNGITKSNILFDNSESDFYTLEETKIIKSEVLKIIDEIYSKYEKLDDYEKFYLALNYCRNNWEFQNIGKTEDKLDYYKDKTGHKYNISLFRILKTKKSVCAGMSCLFRLMLNNPKVNVNVHTVHGEHIPSKEGHVWLNTLINNKVYEQCLTFGCTTSAKDIYGNRKEHIFEKLNEKDYVYSDKFVIQKALGLPLEYSEIPNATQYLSQSVKNKRKRKIIKLDTTQSDFISQYDWQDYSYIADCISELQCKKDTKEQIEEYIYRAIDLNFITKNNINNVLKNLKDYYQKHPNTIIPKNKSFQSITSIILNTNIDVINEDYQKNISRVLSVEIEKGWKKLDDILGKLISDFIENYPNSIDWNLNIGGNFVLYQFGRPLKDCGNKEDKSKDKVIKDLIRKRFNSNYEKSIIEEFSVNNSNYPNMHADFYEMIKTIYNILESKNEELISLSKMKLESLSTVYRDYRDPNYSVEYIDLPTKRQKR